jgi:hypothetical protein
MGGAGSSQQSGEYWLWAVDLGQGSARHRETGLLATVAVVQLEE